MAFCLPKLAVIHLLTRLMNPSRFHKIFLWALGITCNLGLLVTIVMLFKQCNPARAQWDFSVTDGQCLDKYVLVYIAVATAGKFNRYQGLRGGVWAAYAILTSAPGS